MNKCKICNILDGNYPFSDIDKPLLENDHFFALSSIGAFIEGWTLLLPKEHCYSMRTYYSDPYFTSFLTTILNIVKGEYGDLIIFEHGANSNISETSCGTHHAHLHIVPYCSIKTELHRTKMQWVDTKITELPNIPASCEYLFYTEIAKDKDSSIHSGLLHILQSPISQFFRKILANSEDKLKYADYKKYPFLETSELTQKTLIKKFAQLNAT